MRPLLYHMLDNEKIKPRFDELMDAIYVLYELDPEREEAKISKLDQFLLMNLSYSLDEQTNHISCAPIIYSYSTTT